MTSAVSGPTISELEILLNSEGGSVVSITPDGRVVPATPPSMIKQMAKDAQSNQIIIQIGDLAKAAEALETGDGRWDESRALFGDGGCIGGVIGGGDRGR